MALKKCPIYDLIWDIKGYHGKSLRPHNYP